jgi:hypothetical protein
MTDAGLHTLIGARPRIQAGRRLHVVKYTLSHRDAANTPFDVVIEGQSSGVDPGLLAPFEAVGLTWWIEKLGWFRGSVDAARERIRRGPPAPAHPTKSSRP